MLAIMDSSSKIILINVLRKIALTVRLIMMILGNNVENVKIIVQNVTDQMTAKNALVKDMF